MGNIRIVEKNMETTIMGLGFRGLCMRNLTLIV